MSKLISKLTDIARFSDGIFITGQVTDNHKETNYLNMFSKRNPCYFSEIDKQKTKILQLTQFFSNDFLTPKRVPDITDPSEIIQRILWSGLILHDIQPNSFPEHTFRWGKYFFILDDMRSSEEHFRKLKSNFLFHGVVTIEPRLKLFNSMDLWSITPFLCRKIWVKKHLNLYFHKNFSKLSNSSRPKFQFNDSQYSDLEVTKNFLEGAIWPQKEEECHKGRKIYPGIKNPLTGNEKWIIDKSILKSGSEIPEDYFFGIYP